MFSHVLLGTKRCKSVVNACCRFVNTQTELQPLNISALRYNATEKKYIINDTESKLVCFFGDNYGVEKNEVPEIKREVVPKKYFTLKKSRKIKYAFTVDEKVAEKIGNVINPYITEDDIIVETNPGLGLITNQLLQGKAKKIYVSQIGELMPSLQKLINFNKEKLNFIRGTLSSYSIYTERDKMLMLNHLSKYEREGQKFKIVLVLHDNTFFPALSKMITYGHHQFFFDDVEYFVVMNPSIYKSLSTSYKLRWHSYLIFQSLMNLETLCELPRESFLPWSKEKQDCMFLCKISKNLKAFDVIKREDYNKFLQFIKLIGRKKHDCIMPVLEHYSPGCGAELIKSGIVKNWTRAVDLSAIQTAHLYKTFQATPGYLNYKMVTSNEHRGFVEIEDIQNNKLDNEMHDIENLENIMEVT